MAQYEKFLVGSSYFFKRYKDFNSKDTDWLYITDNPTEFKVMRQIHFPNECIFEWEHLTKDEFIQIALSRQCKMEAGKFLNPEVSKYLGMTIEDLKKLESVFNSIDDKHTYEKIIYEAYIENNGFFLTEEQRVKAYNEYKNKRLNSNN